MKRILAQVRKELTQLRRDRLTLALALVLPILLLLLLSKATSLTVKDIPARRTGSRPYAHVTQLH
jgi:ABC-2 type transport system permease protein